MVKFEDSLISNKQAVENMVIISITEFLRCLPITPYSIKVLEMDDMYRHSHNKDSVKASLSTAKYYKDGSSVYDGSLYVAELDTGFNYHITEQYNHSPAITLDYFIISGKKIKPKDIKNADTFILKNTIDKLMYWAMGFYNSYQYTISSMIFDLASDVFKHKTYLDLYIEKGE